MKGIYIEQLKISSAITNEFEKLLYNTSILRSLLQSVTVSAFEVADKKTCTDELPVIDLIDRFKQPADGMPLNALDILIPHLREYIHPRVCYGWFEASTPASENFSREVLEWVEFRNKHAGHGNIDSPLAKEWAARTGSLISRGLEIFSELLPSAVKTSELRLLSKPIDLKLETPLIFDDKAIIISKVQQRKSNWKLKAQTLSLTGSDEIELELPNTTFFDTNDSPRLAYDVVIVSTDSSEQYLEHNIPIRQTDTFEGREKELLQITEWLNDQDSRRCQIYGDGGYGKTTLVLEAFNRYLEGRVTIDKLAPSLICYYTAKMTRWNASGLKHLSSIPPMMRECIFELYKGLGVPLNKSLYSADTKQLISRAETAMQKAGLSRDEVLLIIDNTETLASDKAEAEELADLIREIGKRLCRLVITSRRQEAIEATPISVEGLSIEDSTSLLKRLAKEHKATPILQAGDSKLRRISDKLMRKPILLEALVIYISRANIGIDAALDNLYRHSEETLLEFLYDDAWARLTESQKDIFFVIVSLSADLDDVSIGRACQLLEIQHSEFQRSLAETHFASMTDFGNRYEIELVELAKKFFEKKLSEATEDKSISIKSIASQVDIYVAERDKIEQAYTRDRVADAFRSTAAKAAKVAVDKGDFDEADIYFKLAIEEEPTNASLHDRYSFFLLNKCRDPLRALEMSNKSIDLNPENCDANVTLAMVHYRLGNLPEGDEYIEKSNRVGRPDDFCYLRKGVARYHHAQRIEHKEAVIQHLHTADTFLKMAHKASNTDSGYGIKNLDEIVKYEELTRKKIREHSQR